MLPAVACRHNGLLLHRQKTEVFEHVGSPRLRLCSYPMKDRSHVLFDIRRPEILRTSTKYWYEASCLFTAIHGRSGGLAGPSRNIFVPGRYLFPCLVRCSLSKVTLSNSLHCMSQHRHQEARVCCDSLWLTEWLVVWVDCLMDEHVTSR